MLPNSEEVIYAGLSDFYQKKDKGSYLLAQTLQRCILKNIAEYNVVDRKVKQKISQVLLGAEMPGALIEIGFITNKEEAIKLLDKTYQLRLVEGICKAIDCYCMN